MSIFYFAAAVSKLLEKDLECPRCRAMNDPTVSRIKVDVNGVASCTNCGEGGTYQKFQRKDTP